MKNVVDVLKMLNVVAVESYAISCVCVCIHFVELMVELRFVQTTINSIQYIRNCFGHLNWFVCIVSRGHINRIRTSEMG